MIRVRVAVAVGADGTWCASGYSGAKDQYAIEDASEDMKQRLRIVWLVAEVPEYAEETVEAEVQE